MKNATLRALSRAAFTCLTLLTANAHAENKLFPTDVLTQGQLDGSIGVDRATRDYRWQPDQERREDRIGVEVRAGLGARTHMGLTLVGSEVTHRVPYYDYRASVDYTALQLSMRHALIERGDYTLAIDGAFTRYNFDDSTDNGDLSVFSVGMSAGFKLSSDARAAITVKADVPDDDDADNVYTVSGGLWITVSPRVTVVPSLAWSRDDGDGHDDGFTLGLKADVALDRNTYLSPSISYSPENDDRIKRRSIGVSLYHLF